MLIQFVLNGRRKVVNDKIGRALIKAKAAKEVTEDATFNRSMADKPMVTREVGAASTEAIEVDAAGDEWNADIHAASKVKNQDGTWRKKPGARPASESTE